MRIRPLAGDEGRSWTGPRRLTSGETWHQAPCNVLERNGSVYLVMEKRIYGDVKGWPVSVLAPVLMRGGEDRDLTKRETWTFASGLAFRGLAY